MTDKPVGNEQNEALAFDPETHFEAGIPYAHLCRKREHKGLRFASQMRRPSWHRGAEPSRRLTPRSG